LTKILSSTTVFNID